MLTHKLTIIVAIFTLFSCESLKQKPTDGKNKNEKNDDPVLKDVPKNLAKEKNLKPTAKKGKKRSKNHKKDRTQKNRKDDIKKSLRENKDNMGEFFSYYL